MHFKTETTQLESDVQKTEDGIEFLEQSMNISTDTELRTFCNFQ